MLEVSRDAVASLAVFNRGYSAAYTAKIGKTPITLANRRAIEPYNMDMKTTFAVVNYTSSNLSIESIIVVPFMFC
jgi:hypothetical protein